VLQEQQQRAEFLQFVLATKLECRFAPAFQQAKLRGFIANKCDLCVCVWCTCWWVLASVGVGRWEGLVSDTHETTADALSRSTRCTALATYSADVFDLEGSLGLLTIVSDSNHLQHARSPAVKLTGSISTPQHTPT